MSFVPNNQSNPDTSYLQRLSITVGVVLLGLVAALFVNLPTRPLTFDIFGSPLSLYVSGQYVFVGLLLGLTCTGTDALVRSHPLAQRQPLENTFVMWTVPALTVLLAALAVPLAPSRLIWVGGILATGLVLGLIMTAEYHTIDPQDTRFASSQTVLEGMIYILALASFIIVYSAKSRSLLSATILFLVTSLLALARLRITGHSLSTTRVYALATGLVIGQAVWALNYSRMPGMMGGLFLLLLFHVMVGLSSQYLSGRLTSRLAIEYGLVALVGVGLTVYYFV